MNSTKMKRPFLVTTIMLVSMFLMMTTIITTPISMLERDMHSTHPHHEGSKDIVLTSIKTGSIEINENIKSYHVKSSRFHSKEFKMGQQVETSLKVQAMNEMTLDASYSLENDWELKDVNFQQILIQESTVIFNATLDRTLYASGSTIHISGHLKHDNGTPIAGNQIDINLFDNNDQKITTIQENTKIDGSWNADYQLSTTIPSGGYYFNVSTIVNGTLLSLRLNFMILSESPITITSMTTNPNPPVLGFPMSFVVTLDLSQSDVDTVKAIYTTDNGSSWNQVNLLSSSDHPELFSAVVGTFTTNVVIQWFVMLVDVNGKIKESMLQDTSFQQFTASFSIKTPTNPLTHETHLINFSISTNIPDDFYSVSATIYQSSSVVENLTVWKKGPRQYQTVFYTIMEGQWYLTITMHSNFNDTLIASSTRSLFLTLKDLLPPVIEDVTYDENAILEQRPLKVVISIKENQSEEELAVTVKYRKGTIEGGFESTWTTITLLEPGQNQYETVILTWDVPFLLQEGEILQFQIIAIDGFDNTATSKLYTVTFPLSRDETSNVPFITFLLALTSVLMFKKKLKHHHH